MFLKYLKHLFFISVVGYFIYTPLHYIEEINPLKKELSDFRFTDIYYGHFKEKKVDNEIVLVDIGYKSNEITRFEITKFLNRINDTLKPRVIALDVNFKYDESVSSDVDTNLINALDNENIVMYYDLVKKNNTWLKNRSEISINYSKISEGYTNCLVDKDKFGVLRFFQPYVVQEKDTMRHLSLVVAEKFGAQINPSLMINKKVMINFSYDYNSPVDILDSTNLEIFKDKIVIIDTFEIKSFKTKELYTDLKQFDYKSALFIHSESGIDKNFKLASANIPKVSILNQKGINVKDLISFDKIFIEQKSINEITKRLS